MDIVIGEDVLGTSRNETTGVILAQTGDVIGEEASSNEVEVWQHAGFASRCAPAEAGKDAAQVVSIKTSNRDATIAERDPRTTEMYGALQPGETAIFACVGQARALWKADGSITLATTADNTPTGANVTFTIAPDSLTFASPFLTIQADENAITIRHSSGAVLSLGKIEGIPAPADAMSSYATMSASTCEIEGSAVKLGAGAAYLNCAVSASPVAVPVPTNPTGGSGTVFIAV